MPTEPASRLEPLTPVLGRWRTSGSVLDDAGEATASIAGTDVYALLPGGHWIAHDVDVRIGGERVVLHEVIGGVHGDGGWQMHAFDDAEQPGVMRLTLEEPGVLLLHGDGVRSWFRVGVDGDHLTARWERLVDDRWLPWMDLRLDRG
ncbi:hypothetical protein [Blastococcus haudaquaticus]|uniref:DUF1579 domain-containing protein n=1 Tax=Blastococcus haudaquaticus TaxID=1938745 RepID=A0A286GD94_9ACTN|nr:hypothetical protein [Blastococcus haudaquaticus]SOD93216.1 hypothetical protein SAMN06272739_0224 [Blastococcus haudaquaticus]